jgi:hypothetical protein
MSLFRLEILNLLVCIMQDCSGCKRDSIGTICNSTYRHYHPTLTTHPPLLYRSLGGYPSNPRNNTPPGPQQRGQRDGSKGGILDPDRAPNRRNSDEQYIVESSTMGGSRSGSMGRDRFNVTAPASTFATPVAALSFSGADYSQGVGAGPGALQ